MKKLVSVLTAVLLTVNVFAQSPNKMSYQAVIRNSANLLVCNATVGMRISILRDSASGVSVYTETQNPATNANGLVSLEIGGGTVVSGSFNTINWSVGKFFIKTETDLSGGSNYTLIGSSQLLSVPFAMHAKTADALTISVTETDPVFASSHAASISAADITHLGNLSGTNTGDQDGSETKVTAGDGIIVTGSGTTASPYLVKTVPPIIIVGPSIGDPYKGGIIFWLDGSGHGLIVAASDISNGVQWCNGTNRTTGAKGDALFSGWMNTAIIVSSQEADYQTGVYAAKLCSNYYANDGGITYGGWYLPSSYELNLLYLQKSAVGGLSGSYWSSTENNNIISWGQNFNDGSWLSSYKTSTYKVRPIRAF